MGDRCSNAIVCPGGNCPGCKDGLPFCGDPRCAPFCNGCLMPEHHDSVLGWVIVAIILLLLTLTFVIWYIFGSKWFTPHSDHVRAGVVTPENVHLFVDSSTGNFYYQ